MCLRRWRRTAWGRCAVPVRCGLTVAQAAGLSVINFDGLDTSGGSVGGAALSNYLAGYGVTLSNVTVGTAWRRSIGGLVAGGGGAVASSPPNYFTQAGLNTAGEFHAGFEDAVRRNLDLRGWGWWRGRAGVTHPKWKATLLNAKGTELGSAGEGLIVSATNVPARAFAAVGCGDSGGAV